jgi:NNP family nitrate/nitrite transporter-like MFS transporter
VSWQCRPALSLLVAVCGYGVTFWAWSLTGPLGLAAHLWSRLDGDVALLALFTAVIVGSLGRIPVGVLTDRHGPRAVLPAISVVAAIAVLLLAVVGSGPAMLAVAVPLGIAGTNFVAGAAVVMRAYPPHRRGLWLSVYGAAMGVASAAAVVSRLWFTLDRRTALPLLALALIGHAMLAAALLRDQPRSGAARTDGRQIVLALLRLPVTRYLSGWYAVAFGGLIGAGVYLPAYLRHVHDLPIELAALVTAGCLTLAAACRPLGGWLCRHHDAVGLLRVAFAGAGAAVLVLAFHPPLAAAVAVLGGLSACLGTASGIVQALIGATAPVHQAGAVVGTVGAVGGLAGVLPPLLLVTTRGVSGSYGIGLTLLAAIVTVTAWQLHRRARAIGAVLAFPDPATTGAAGTTVAVTPPFNGSQAHRASATAALATLATRHELVVVAPGDASALIEGLRLHLPRHRVIGITTGAEPHPHETRLIAELLNDGALPVVETAGARPEATALHLAAALHAGDILRIHADHTDLAPSDPAAPLVTWTPRG